MQLSSSAESKSSTASESRFHAAREMPHRIAHGGMAWASSLEPKLYQPQDGAVAARSRVADIASRLRKMADEPEDARLTGGTRSLMRRLSGLNMGKVGFVRRTLPLTPRSVALQLNKANVA